MVGRKTEYANEQTNEQPSKVSGSLRGTPIFGAPRHVALRLNPDWFNASNMFLLVKFVSVGFPMFAIAWHLWYLIAEFFFVCSLFARTSYGALLMLGLKEGSQMLLQDFATDSVQLAPWHSPSPGKLLFGAAMPFLTAAARRVLQR